MKIRPKALMIGNEPAVRRLVRVALSKQNYRVFEAIDGESGSRLATEHDPDVILLDSELPDMNGIEWLKNFREKSRTPVLVLSCFDSSELKIAALDAGADDHLPKPFSVAELLARLRVLQRSRPGISESPLLEEGRLKIDRNAHKVTWSGSPLELTLAEEALFYLLVQHVGKVVTNAQLLRSVWGTESNGRTHQLQVLVARIRRKLEAQGNRILIRTIGHLGYQLVVATNFEAAPVSTENAIPPS